MQVVCDIEANGLRNPTIIWCVVAKDIETGNVYEFYEDTIKDFKAFAEGVTHWIGHNFIVYDRKALKSILGIDIKPKDITDTLVMSRLEDPVRQQGHSLARWGRFFKVFKKGHEEWDRFSQAMLERCRGDVEINYKTDRHLEKKLSKFSRHSIRLEHNMAVLLDEVHERGWKLDVEKAEQIYTECVAKTQKIARSFDNGGWPSLPYPKRLVKFRRTQNGAAFKNCTRPLGKGHTPVGDYTLIEWRSFNPSSPRLVVAFLHHFGWSPTEFTKAGNPRVSEANLSTLSPNAPASAKDIKTYLILNSRAKMIANWLDNTWEDDRAHGSIISPAAKTHRAAHRDPNSANIPGIHDRQGRPALYGLECRQCWTVDDLLYRRLVGTDASGIQLRILAHTANDPAYTELVIAGDVHQYHADILGSERSVAKTFIYAWILNASYKKVALILGCSLAEAKRVMQDFLKRNPALARVRNKMKILAKRGVYRATDGRLIRIPSYHIALACVLQGEESIIMRKAGVRWRAQARKEDLDAAIVGWVHDEYQIDSHLTCAERSGIIMVDKIKEAGEILKFNVPLDGEYKIGLTWADTH